jgi:hypothetical protein
MKRREFLKVAAASTALIATGGLLAAESVPTFRATISQNAMGIILPAGQCESFIEDTCVIRREIDGYVPFMDVRKTLGRVNPQLIRIIDDKTEKMLNCHPETLLFMGAFVTQCSPDKWILDFKVSHHSVKAVDQSSPGGWNHFWMPNKGGFHRLYGMQPYPQEDFVPLLRS